MPDASFLEEIRKHAGGPISTTELQERLDNPEKYVDFDTIEVVGE